MTRDEWLSERTFAPTIDPGEIAAARDAAGLRVSVVLPALNVAATVGPICDAIRTHWMNAHNLVDELVVIDSNSTDATARLATEAGATVVQDAHVARAQGTRRGKGEAMWKSLAATTGDVVIWIDADIETFDPEFVPRLLWPLVFVPSVAFVKGFYRRPLGTTADDGGRVTEICARPLINRYLPELAGFLQPLAGEAAGRRTVLERVPFFTGYAVEIGLLIDVLARVGLQGMAQVNLGERRHHHQSTPALGRMAYEITEAVLRRTGRDGGGTGDYLRPVPGDDGYRFESVPVMLDERPPMAIIRAEEPR